MELSPCPLKIILSRTVAVFKISFKLNGKIALTLLKRKKLKCNLTLASKKCVAYVVVNFLGVKSKELQLLAL